jgi:hypothetical protein
LEADTTTEKLAVKALGDSGNGAGRLRIDFAEDIGLMRERAGDWTPALKKVCDAIFDREVVRFVTVVK